MKRFASLFFAVLFFTMVFVPPAEAAGTRVIVRVQGGLPVLQNVCRLLHCTVNYGLGDPGDQVFLVTLPISLLQNVLLNTLTLQLGILSVEVDVQGNVLAGSGGAPAIPPALYDSTPVNYYGATVRRGYVNQPANDILGIARAQNQFLVDGAGIVAVIDTGVDTHHPALIPVLLPGYDFTRNRESADERGDVSQSISAVVDGTGPVWVNQSVAAVVDQSVAAVVDGSGYDAFGHGTMVAGVIHLVAPKAYILPLKAFNANGSGYKSDVIRAIYRAVNANAKVLNMSFNFPGSSTELNLAITYANLRNVICVASAGNDGRNVAVYPASYTNRVMGVASTTNADVRSSFSNYGATHVFVAAPGEGVVTTYPWGAYAAVWGTSFSAPFVAGTAALLYDVSASVNEVEAAKAIAHAKFISTDLGKGRLDIYQAVAAWRQTLGIR